MEQFTKNDLRTGDLVVTADGYSFIVILGFGTKSKNVLITEYGNWCSLDKFNSNVMKVYRPELECSVLSFEKNMRELIYDREAIENKTEKMNSENVVLYIDGEKINATNLEMTIKGFGEKQQEWTIKIKTK